MVKQRNPRPDKIFITVLGVTKSLRIWAEITGINYEAARKRYSRGLRGEGVVTPKRIMNGPRSCSKCGTFGGYQPKKQVNPARWHITVRGTEHLLCSTCYQRYLAFKKRKRKE